MAVEFIDPGALRTELSLQAVTPAGDGEGGYDETWHETATVLARVEPVAAGRLFGPQQPIERVSHRVTLRHRDGVAAGMRFVRQGRALAIVAVHDPDESGRYLTCLVQEDTP